MTLTVLWLVVYAVVLTRLPSPEPWLLALSAGYPVYYVALSLHLTGQRRRRSSPVAAIG
jgi:phosphatidylcholine synthase